MVKNKTNWNQDYYNDYALKLLFRYVDGTFEIDENGFINVDGGVNLVGNKLISTPFKFGKVTGYFWCHNNNLTSLKGIPYYVGNDFSCSSNRLESLKYAPKYVGNDFYCYGNNRIFSIIEIMKHVKVIRRILNQ